MKYPKEIDIYFGVPGAGKTTVASAIAKKYIKHGIPVYSNVLIDGTYTIDVREDIGKYNIHDALIIIDEAGIEYNNRDFKSNMPKEVLYFYKMHRHYNTQIIIFSQGYDDMDKKLRVLAQRLYVVKRSLIPFVISVKQISKKIGINELTKEIIDEYYFTPLYFRYYFAPRYWKLFNSFEHITLPDKTFSVFHSVDCRKSPERLPDNSGHLRNIIPKH